MSFINTKRTLRSCVLFSITTITVIYCVYRGINWKPSSVLPTEDQRKDLAVSTLRYFYQTENGVDEYMAMVTQNQLPDYHSPCWKEDVNPSSMPFRNRYWTSLYHGIKILRSPLTSVQEALEGQLSRGVTSRLRCLPAVYLAGVYKSGTTDLFDTLSSHPRIFPGMMKESMLHFWHKGRMAPVGLSDYIGLFDLAALRIENQTVITNGRLVHPGLTIEGSPFLFHMYRNWKSLPWNENATEPRVFMADHIKVINPRAKVIFILRNPITWLESCYNHINRNFTPFSSEDLHSRVARDISNFERCSEMGGSLTQCVYNYNTDSCSVLNALYFAHIHIWMQRFDRRQLCIVRAETYYGNRHTALDAIFDFLNIPRSDSQHKSKINEMLIKNNFRSSCGYA